MSIVSLPAHFDGDRIQLDEPFDLPKNAPLLVCILTSDQQDTCRQEMLKLSLDGLARAYGDDEPEYTIADVKP